jgi:hypothetical protein
MAPKSVSSWAQSRAWGKSARQRIEAVVESNADPLNAGLNGTARRKKILESELGDLVEQPDIRALIQRKSRNTL